MAYACRICGGDIGGGEIGIWETDQGGQHVETYLDDLRTSPAAVMHPRCFISEHGVEKFLGLAQVHMIDLASSLNEAALLITAQNDKLREHRLEPIELPLRSR